MRVINLLILKFKKKEFNKCLGIFKKIQVDRVYKILLRESKERNLDVEEIVNKRNKFILKIKVDNKVILINFHKTLAVTLNDYDMFVSLYNKLEAKKCYYITTGVFQQDIYNKNYGFLLQKQIVLVDGVEFVIGQDLFKLNKNQNNNISFKKYLRKI